MALSPNSSHGPSWPIWTRRRVRRSGYTLRFSTRPRGPSPAMRVAEDAMRDHRHRWDAARWATLRELGSNAVPVCDAALDLTAGPVRRAAYRGGLR